MNVKIEISEQEIKDIKSIRNYFGEHDKTVFEHSAYDIIDRFLNKIKGQSAATSIIDDYHRYPMTYDQPCQIDCRVSNCKFYKCGGKCENVSPAITLNEDGNFVCWSSISENQSSKKSPASLDEYENELIKFHNANPNMGITIIQDEILYNDDHYTASQLRDILITKDKIINWISVIFACAIVALIYLI